MWDIDPRWNIIQPWKGSGRKFWLMLWQGWTLRTLCQVKPASQKDTYRMIPRTWGTSEQPNPWRQTDAISGHREGEMGSYSWMDTEFPNGTTKKFWTWIVAELQDTVNTLNATEFTLKMAKMTNFINILPWLKQKAHEINFCTRMRPWGTSSPPSVVLVPKTEHRFSFNSHHLSSWRTLHS